MADLKGRRIVVLEARMPSELGSLVTRHGGEAISAPALREAALPMRQDVRDVIDGICAHTIQTAVFLTGVGARALINAADELGRKDEFLDALRETTVICRGPKPVAVLKPLNVPIALVSPSPYTSEDLLAAIKESDIDLGGKRVSLQHYGEVNAWLRGELEALGADVLEVSLYSWQLPEDTKPVVDAISRMLARDAGRGDADHAIAGAQPLSHRGAGGACGRTPRGAFVGRRCSVRGAGLHARAA